MQRSRFGLAAWLMLLTAAYVGLLYLVYRGFVHTERGHYVEATALAGNTIGEARISHGVLQVLNAVSVASLAAATAAIGFIALVRRRIVLAIAAVVLIGGSNLTTQVLKYGELWRPEYGFDPSSGSANSLPSGHATVAASVAVALVLVLPPRLRGTAALFGAAYAGITGVATLSAGWHRPSDAIAAYLVVGGWAAGVALLLVLAQRSDARATSHDAHPVAVSLLLATGAGLVVIGLSALYLTNEVIPTPIDELSRQRLFVAYAGSAAGIAGTMAIVMAISLATLHRVVPRFLRAPKQRRSGQAAAPAGSPIPRQSPQPTTADLSLDARD
ncbi:phosphatase PAP2 family protein [Flindersiella endophytica]